MATQKFLRFVDAGVLDKLYSDHRPVWALARMRVGTHNLFIRIGHHSLEGHDSREQKRAEIKRAFDQKKRNIIGFTEVDAVAWEYIQSFADAKGFDVYKNPWGEAVAIDFRAGRVIKHGYTKDPYIKGVKGQYPNRSMIYVTWEHHIMGRFTHVVWHNVPKDYVPSRRDLNRSMNKSIASWMTWKRKFGTVTFSADSNVDDKTDSYKSASTKPISDVGITCWDELQTWPDTRDTRTIDIIGRVD